MMNVHIPDKLAIKQKEVTRITKLEGKVIDYWQKEFGGFEPTVNKDGEKFYTKKDIQLILKIKQWMIVDKIEKAKIKEMLGANLEEDDEERISDEGGTNSPEEMRAISTDQLKFIKLSLQEILTILDKNDKR